MKEDRLLTSFSDEIITLGAKSPSDSNNVSVTVADVLRPYKPMSETLGFPVRGLKISATGEIIPYVYLSDIKEALGTNPADYAADINLDGVYPDDNAVTLTLTIHNQDYRVALTDYIYKNVYEWYRTILGIIYDPESDVSARVVNDYGGLKAHIHNESAENYTVDIAGLYTLISRCFGATHKAREPHFKMSEYPIGSKLLEYFRLVVRSELNGYSDAVEIKYEVANNNGSGIISTIGEQPQPSLFITAEEPITPNEYYESSEKLEHGSSSTLAPDSISNPKPTSERVTSVILSKGVPISKDLLRDDILDFMFAVARDNRKVDFYFITKEYVIIHVEANPNAVIDDTPNVQYIQAVCFILGEYLKFLTPSHYDAIEDSETARIVDTIGVKYTSKLDFDIHIIKSHGLVSDVVRVSDLVMNTINTGLKGENSHYINPKLWLDAINIATGSYDGMKTAVNFDKNGDVSELSVSVGGVINHYKPWITMANVLTMIVNSDQEEAAVVTNNVTTTIKSKPVLNKMLDALTLHTFNGKRELTW